MRVTRAEHQRCHPTATDLVAVSAELTRLTAAQDGVLSRPQLALHGVHTPQIRTATAALRWRAFGRRVVVLHNAPLTQNQRDWAAVLMPSKPCALAGLSAATSAGLRGFEPDEVHILVRHDTRTNVPSWVKVHESRRFSAADIVEASPPRTGITRALVDAAAWSTSPRRACAILCAGVQQRLTTAARLETELAKAGAVRHVEILRSIVGDIGGGGHTLAEIDLGPLAVTAGLPAPRRQAVRREPDGRARYVDAEFDLPDGATLVVEIDGAVHLLPTSWWNDAHRQNEIVIAGSPVLRFPSIVVRLEPAQVIDQLRRMRIAHETRR